MVSEGRCIRVHKSGFPYQTRRLARKIKSSLINLASGMENQGFLNRPAVEDVASEVKVSEFSERGMKKLRLQA